MIKRILKAIFNAMVESGERRAEYYMKMHRNYHI